MIHASVLSVMANVIHSHSILFAIMFALSIAELYFTLDSFIYLQRKHKWYNNTERARLAFLTFSAVRTIVLAAVYAG